MKKLKPVIIPRADHPISRRQISPNALKVLYRLRDNGFLAYLVGGCVRDLLLGREPKDFDVVTDATPNQIKKIFRNCRLIGRRFRLAHLHFNDEIIEVATFRSALPLESGPEYGQEGTEEGRRRPPLHLKSDDGMVLRDNVFGTPQEDALRRDFTVNALSYNIRDYSIFDYAGGMEDLQRGVIRLIGEPRTRFTEDPVRMIRAVRFAAMLGFSIDEPAWAALTDMADSITKAAPARLFEEVLKLFLLGEGEKCFHLLRRAGLFQSLFPHFSKWLDRESGDFPHTGPGRGIAWIDARIQTGGKVSAPLFLALLFGDYIEEEAAELQGPGVSQQQALNAAVAEFLGETAPTVQIPNRIGMGVRDILAAQRRFLKTPGKNVRGFLTRPFYADALDYLRCVAITSSDAGRLVAWWEGHGVLPAGDTPNMVEEAKSANPGKKRRRRRGRGRKQKEGPDS